MLDKQDLIMLKDMMQEVVHDNLVKNNIVIDQKLTSLENRMESRMDEKLTSLENRMENRMDEKLTSLESRMDEKLTSLEDRMDEKLTSLEDRMDEKLTSLEDRMTERMDKKFVKMEDFLLDEMDRYYKMTQKDIQGLTQKVDEISEYYRIKKSEDDMTEKLFLLYQNQQKQIDEIKEMIAV